MIAWSSMLVERLQIHHLSERVSGELHISDSSLWLPDTTLAAPPAQPFQDKPSCGAWTRSMLLRGDRDSSTLEILPLFCVLPPKQVAGSSVSEGQNEKDGAGASFLSSPLILLCCVGNTRYLMENGHHCLMQMKQKGKLAEWGLMLLGAALWLPHS